MQLLFSRLNCPSVLSRSSYRDAPAPDQSCVLLWTCFNCSMSSLCWSNTNHSPFLLMGIPDLEALHMWISIPFCLTYIMSLLGNGMVLLTVVLDKTLHEPMYYFISMLAVIDLIFSTAVVPKMLAVLWLDSREIGFEACFIQMFFIHTFTAVESGVLLAMSFDRYIAICNPLRYSTILTTSRTIQIGLLSLARGTGVMTPLMCLLTSLPYCGTRVIPHSYCEHMAVVALACADPTVSDLYSIIVATLLVGTDSVFIAFSYTMILRSVMRLPSQEARLKALSTCGSHVSIILLFYIGGLLSMYLQMFSVGSAPHVQVLVADFYLTVPPMLNPLIYGLKMKQIQEGMLKLLRHLVRLSVPQADKDRSDAERRRHPQKRIDPIVEQV
uniref:Olfactory receptor n=1 Tax=Amazona collaria TaxID=241587 RepID=A0A8B9G9T2_9PSIT